MSAPAPAPVDSSAFNHRRARVAALTRSRTPDDPELVDERAKMEVASRRRRADGLAAYVQRVVATMPPLDDEQVDKIVMLLRGGDAG